MEDNWWKFFSDVKWAGFIDKKAAGNFLGIPIRKWEDYQNVDFKISVSNQVGYDEIRKELISYGVLQKDIICLEEYNNEASVNQYFEKRCIDLQKARTFVDAGAYDGRDSKRFIQYKEGKINKIWMFEPDKKQLDEFDGKRVISFEEYIEQYRNEMILISSRIYNEEIYKQLKENGISEENIINIGNLNDKLNKLQYFDLPELYIDLKKREVFVDAGALDGRTSILFRMWAGESFGKVYTVEPDESNLNFLENNLKQAGLEEYTIVSKGLWNKEDVLCFEANGNGVSKVSSEGEEKIYVDKLDNLVKDEISFIKMDIEGG